jgi:hypothetical protein
LTGPLVSSGTVTLKADGFIWHQTSPFENIMTFDGDSIVETTKLGNESIERTLQDPIANSVTETLFQLMSGSWSAIESSFSIEDRPPDDGASWMLDLTPRQEDVRMLLPLIAISGNEHLERISILQGDGNLILIEFRHQKHSQ